ncbi:MAG: hypothetical protein A3H50_03515 [Candidatus Levybacteria bacterium RIFCSPLOWO2_02_FULL_37_10]|uniref:Uncharacterized protein n=1 Tax=Candidatus Wildermuthbacteria bacterium RIFCSPHIGHO2_12_FULL_40_12 TaxID=1802457 RepID=A0A1G2RFY5_9BACT|nr:MAG: hypothetical protein A2860_02410 [Candidatus Levybacteria bacterium RIFCSPHIGHO2_01_FULL_37_33]OGH15809.1 MAG: hypothetical protein A3C97_01015 [Candidatus Levybacteria bacterium RIFCSPHIGHO2_02_FULL_37_11]OGH43126.1 MAG: hypothetical protein A3H50_03515 [Candidatus Levybacteria bacterium RIFCSPLOWO2_02_FULL_37_10]OHA70971.1 MAG: hypothetical protein A3F15_00290 [Candidatus Wildermuthbacteria bacterium RIFCSPHIGHO2_12_FULL_40_12]
MFTKNKLVILLVSILALAGVLAVIKPYLAPSSQNPPNTSPESSKVAQLELKYPYDVKNVTDKEKEEIIQLVKTFETLQYERRAKKVLDLFTPPVNNDEKGWLDHLEGKDINSKPRLYITAGFPSYLNWYMVRRIEKQDGAIQVTLKELRTFYDNSTADYDARVENLTLVMRNVNGSYKIEKYYHEKPLPTVNIKYEGLY